MTAPKAVQTGPLVERAAAKGGRGLCAACGHADREQIDRELVGRVPQREIAARYGISRTSLRRHQAAHVSSNLVVVTPVADVITRVGAEGPILAELRELADIAKQSLRSALLAGSNHQAMAAQREARQTLELIAKITGELDTRPVTVINIQQTAEWVPVREVVYEILARRPEDLAELDERLKLLEVAP